MTHVWITKQTCVLCPNNRPVLEHYTYISISLRKILEAQHYFSQHFKQYIYSTYCIHVCQLFCHKVFLENREFFWTSLQFLFITQVRGGSAKGPICPGWKTQLSKFVQQTESKQMFVYFKTSLYILQQNTQRVLPDVMAPLCCIFQ